MFSQVLTSNKDNQTKLIDEAKIVTIKVFKTTSNLSIKSTKNEISYLSTSMDSRANRRRQSRFENTNKTVMLVGVVCFFLVCQFPSLFLHLYDSLRDISQNSDLNEIDENYFTYRYFLEISKLLSVFNLSFNFAFFYLFSKRFRKDLRSFFKSCLFSKKIT